MKPRKLRRILVPIDFSEESMNTLRVAKLLAERCGAQLDLLNVIAPSTPYDAKLIGLAVVRLVTGVQSDAGDLRRSRVEQWQYVHAHHAAILEPQQPQRCRPAILSRWPRPLRLAQAVQDVPDPCWHSTLRARRRTAPG